MLSDRKTEFSHLKKEALDLLQWALDDISPDPEHRLYLKMGIEREGHFIPPDLKRLRKYDPEEWGVRVSDAVSELADYLDRKLSGRRELHIDRIYRDPSGTFQIEMTTQPVSPKLSALSTIRTCNAMKEMASEQEGIENARFGTMRAGFLKSVEDEYKSEFMDFEGEVFESPEDGSPLLVGRGQHANISLWCGDKNLFHESGYKYDNPETLGEAMVNHSVNMLPGMIMPSRKGNYFRIASNANISVQTIELGHNHKHGNAINWVDEVPAELLNGPISNYVRMEFRQGAADADPLDIALAAAIPVTKAALEHISQKNGKAVITSDNTPEYILDNIPGAQTTKMPQNEEQAARMFNVKDNPNFKFLNQLAERKIAALEKQAEQTGNMADRIAARDARQALDGLGTRLHELYCEQYGLRSEMQRSKPRATSLG